jgi:hypothetical protein
MQMPGLRARHGGVCSQSGKAVHSTAFGGELKKAVTAAIKKIIMNPSHD